MAAAKRVIRRAQHASEADEIRTTAGVGERILQLVVVEDRGGPGCGSKAQQDCNGARERVDRISSLSPV